MRAAPLALALALTGCPNPPPAGTDSGPCDLCTSAGEVSCQAGITERVCTPDAAGCLRWVANLCGDGNLCEDGTGCIACSGPNGTFTNGSIEVTYADDSTETRYYFLHVPGTYDCATPMPALFDQHGTAGAPAPEEAYALQEAVDAANREGFILVRPRSRSSIEGGPGGAEIFRWDQNPGDPEKNHAFILQLVTELSARYRFDPERLYACGFSSGTNQTTALAADPASPFSGYGSFGGGSWTSTALPPEAASARYYLTTGLRDYMRTFNDNLLLLLDAAAVPAANRLVRDTDTGHELYGWMYDELWPFLDRGETPPAGALAAAWTEEPLPAATGSLGALARRADATLVATGDDAGLWTRDGATGTWASAPLAIGGTTAYGSEALCALCFGGPMSYGLAAGNGLVAETLDDGQSFSYLLLPDVSASPFLDPSTEAAACDPGIAVVGGYWFGAYTLDGTTWMDAAFDYPYGRAMIAAIRGSSWSTWVAAGYYAYLGRSMDGVTWDARTAPGTVKWIDDVAPVDLGEWIAVAEDAQILRSTDDGLTWTLVHSGPGDHLYAVSFRDPTTGLAVGRRGAAYLTEDGGATWTDVSSGVDRFLGDVAWLSDGTALVVGAGGSALVFDPAG